MSAKIEKLREYLREAGIEFVISNRDEIYIDGVIYELSKLVEELISPPKAVMDKRAKRHPEPFYCRKWR